MASQINVGPIPAKSYICVYPQTQSTHTNATWNDWSTIIQRNLYQFVRAFPKSRNFILDDLLFWRKKTWTISCLWLNCDKNDLCSDSSEPNFNDKRIIWTHLNQAIRFINNIYILDLKQWFGQSFHFQSGIHVFRRYNYSNWPKLPKRKLYGSENRTGQREPE